jgi:hypothetical protein
MNSARFHFALFRDRPDLTPAGKRFLPALAGAMLCCELVSAGTNNTTERLGLVPPPPLPPVTQFTQLCSATPEERTNQLAGKAPRAREIILRQLAQFDALSGPEWQERILQLRVAQLRYYLAPLLRAPEEQRTALLAQVPETERELITSRLAAWDRLPATTRAEVLQSEATLRHFVGQTQNATVAQISDALNRASATLEPGVLAEFRRWLELTPAERQQRTQNFERFFDFSPDEQTRVLGTLTEVERRRMEQSLAYFNSLTPEKRALCLKNFDRLARLSEAERTEFLQNAAHWKAMTKSERDAWRRLLLPSSPPLPPVQSENVAHQ